MWSKMWKKVMTSRVPSIPRQNQESNPELDPDELGWPIALRKGVRTCAQHPIQRFVSYGNLSSRMQSFVVNSSQVKIPGSFQQAMSDPEGNRRGTESSERE